MCPCTCKKNLETKIECFAIFYRWEWVRGRRCGLEQRRSIHKGNRAREQQKKIVKYNPGYLKDILKSGITLHNPDDWESPSANTLRRSLLPFHSEGRKPRKLIIWAPGNDVVSGGFVLEHCSFIATLSPFLPACLVIDRKQRPSPPVFVSSR